MFLNFIQLSLHFNKYFLIWHQEIHKFRDSYIKKDMYNMVHVLYNIYFFGLQNIYRRKFKNLCFNVYGCKFEMFCIIYAKEDFCLDVRWRWLGKSTAHKSLKIWMRIHKAGHKLPKSQICHFLIIIRDFNYNV